jgi:hypothetical protein
VGKRSTSSPHGLEPMPWMPAILEEVSGLDDAVRTVQLAGGQGCARPEPCRPDAERKETGRHI